MTTNKKKRSSERAPQKNTRTVKRKSGAATIVHRLTADELRESETRYRSLFENMINGFAFHKIVLDKKGNPVDYVFLEVNNSFERLTGLKGKDIIGRRVTDVLPGIEKDPADWIGVYGRVALTGKNIRFEQYAAPIGRWYSVAAYSPIKNYFVTFFEDITERKRAEELLLLSESRLKRSQEMAHLGSWELDLINNRLYWSDEVYRIFGLQPQEFAATYEAFLEAVHPDDRTAVNQAYSGSIREGRDIYEIDHRVVRKSTGEVRIVHEKCQHVRDESGRITRSLGMVHDITERNRAEERRKHLASFPQLNPNPVMETDSSGKIKYLNPAIKKIFEDNGMDTNNAHLFIPDDLDDILRQLKKKPECTVHREVVVNDRIFGSTVHFAPQFNVVRIYAHDITDRKRAEEEREKLLEEVKRSNKELEQFAYIASHDLLEPLRTVSSYVQLISRRYKDRLDGDAQEFMNYAISGAAHMQLLLNGLLAYSLIGGSGGRFELTDLNSALAEATANLKTTIESCRAVIEHESLPIVYLEKVQMIQVFQNLISNAIKFRGNEAPRIHVSAERKQNEWEISVSDNGIGIKPDYSERIFKIFKRLHPREKFDGTGIGLAICKKIVERHSGRIWVESQPGKGSTFYFTIPDKSYNI